MLCWSAAPQRLVLGAWVVQHGRLIFAAGISPRNSFGLTCEVEKLIVVLGGGCFVCGVAFFSWRWWVVGCDVGGVKWARRHKRQLSAASSAGDVAARGRRRRHALGGLVLHIEGGMPVPDLVLSGGAGPPSGRRGRRSRSSFDDHRLLLGLRGLTYRNAADSALDQFTARRWDQACGPKRHGLITQAAKTLVPVVRRRSLCRGRSYGALGAAAVDGCWGGHWRARA